jgi:uncharacterized protein YjbJ (UPF0337 family)
MCSTVPTAGATAHILRKPLIDIENLPDGVAALRPRNTLGALANAGTEKEITMNWDVIEGNWKQFKGQVKEQWGKLTDDNLDTIAGKRDQLAGRIQEAYGITKDQAEIQVKAFEETHKDYQPTSTV